VVRLLAISAKVLLNRHSIEEDEGLWLEATVLCNARAPAACSRPTPVSNPISEENREVGAVHDDVLLDEGVP